VTDYQKVENLFNSLFDIALRGIEARIQQINKDVEEYKLKVSVGKTDALGR
jgi:hypothetical protein